MNKKLRWYIVHEPQEELSYVVCSTSHTKAKIAVLETNLWYCDKWEAMQEKCQLVKQKLPIEPTKDWELYPDDNLQDLVDVWIYDYIVR